ncbi:MAG: hypothetical protein BWZ08_00766 [candidate division BRC1 bacterium ADurb.BinA292]|nr:MAG: hypothetical protein BWZ08_00766 [candidate division BRC1 bacterium ADurb.BinA292]
MNPGRDSVLRATPARRWLVAGLLILACASAPAADPDAPAASGAVPTREEIREKELQLLRRQLTELRRKYEENLISRLVYETQVQVAAIRGFQIEAPVQFKPLTNRVLDQILMETVERSYPGPTLTLHVWLNELFGALPEGIDLLKLYRDLMGEQAAGLYDPESKTLFVREDFPMEQAMGRLILAHEICHALQDQQFGLAEMGVEDTGNADRSLATLALAEGDATLLMGEHMARYGNPLSLFSNLPDMMLMNQEQLNRAPRAIQRELLFPYLDGMRFFEELNGRLPADSEHAGQVADSPAEWRNWVWLDPPVSTEMILHPEKYLARELPVEIEPLGEDDEHSAETTIGEFGMSLLLEAALGHERANEAAAGWHGDRIRLSQELDGEGQPAIRRLHWVTHWDSPGDADQFAQALVDAFNERIDGLTWEEAGPERKAGAPSAELTLTRPGETSVELVGLFRLNGAGEEAAPTSFAAAGGSAGVE